MNHLNVCIIILLIYIESYLFVKNFLRVLCGQLFCGLKIGEVANGLQISAERLQKLQASQKHRYIWKTQKNENSRFLRNMRHRKTSVLTLMVTQDFSQLTLTVSLTQELIMVFSCYKRGAFKQEYHHFIAPVGPGWKNDVTFVIGVWEALDGEGKFTPYNKIIIWSDGGPKHFKQRFNLRYMHAKSVEWAEQGRTVEYHFFGSSHGSNACDSAASHGKKRVKNRANNKKQRITTTDKVFFNSSFTCSNCCLD